MDSCALSPASPDACFPFPSIPAALKCKPHSQCLSNVSSFFAFASGIEYSHHWLGFVVLIRAEAGKKNKPEQSHGIWPAGLLVRRKRYEHHVAFE